MPLAIPPELKKISPFVRRAEELDRDKTSPESRLVAYYCRQYAVHEGIPLASSSVAAKTCLGHLLAQLEKEKLAMDNFTRDEAAFLCRKFAMGIFDKADQDDRAGASSKNTAKAFYAAASFLQILEQFELEGSDEDTEDRKRIIYAKWKATEILKALKEGRAPVPGGYGEFNAGIDDSDEEEQDQGALAPTGGTATNDDKGEEEKEDLMFDLPRAASKPMPAPQSIAPPSLEETDKDSVEEESDVEEGQEVMLDPQPPAYPTTTNSMFNPTTSPLDRPKIGFSFPPPVEPPPQPPKKGLFGFGSKKVGGTSDTVSVSKTQMADATELTRFALSALQDKDVDLAVERLQQALAALGR
jgi:vacuolar protein sorting-associated protein VTA1